MITGFNTDIEHGGVTYHVQTEDKGLKKPLILSLVYTGGEILASKRSPYDDLIAAGFDEKALAERLKRQHKLICAAIKQGRIEDLRRMSMRGAATDSPPQIEPDSQAEIAQVEQAEVLFEKPPSLNQEDNATEPLLEIPVEILDESADLPEVRLEPTAVKVLGEKDKSLFPAGQIPQSKSVQMLPETAAVPDAAPLEVLSLRLLEDREFRGGERVELQILVMHGAKKAIRNAEVMVKILGSSFRPQIFHAKTGSEGIAVVNLQLPHFKSGRAAILIRSESGGEFVELRRIVSQG